MKQKPLLVMNELTGEVYIVTKYAIDMSSPTDNTCTIHADERCLIPEQALDEIIKRRAKFRRRNRRKK